MTNPQPINNDALLEADKLEELAAKASAEVGSHLTSHALGVSLLTIDIARNRARQLRTLATKEQSND